MWKVGRRAKWKAILIMCWVMIYIIKLYEQSYFIVVFTCVIYDMVKGLKVYASRRNISTCSI